VWVNKIFANLNEEKINAILNCYEKDGLLEKRKFLIQKFLMAKINILKDLFNKEVPNVE
jgi:hypothetical protein